MSALDRLLQGPVLISFYISLFALNIGLFISFVGLSQSSLYSLPHASHMLPLYSPDLKDYQKWSVNFLKCVLFL